jgi:hypothetical protein
MKKTRVIALLASSCTLLALLSPSFARATSSRSAAFSVTTRSDGRLLGTVNLRQLSSRANGSGVSAGASYRAAIPAHRIPRRSTGARAINLPNPTPVPVIQQDTPGFLGWRGITSRQSRESNHGNHFTVEPPEPVVCMGNDQVFEVVNSALRVFDTSGNALTDVIDINAFMLLPPAIDREHAPHFPGPFSGDIQCEYDQGTGRWFIMIWAIDQDPATGAFTNGNQYYTAVSQSSDALGGWYIYESNADSPHPGDPDPRFGDHPFIGTDANVYVIQDNEFSAPDFTTFFGSVLHIFSKASLESGSIGRETIIRPHPLAKWYSLQPATVPPGGSYESAQGGTLYFASALDFAGTGDDRVALWALTNTSSVESPTPAFGLQRRLVQTEEYATAGGQVTQPAGPVPLGDAVGEAENGLDGGFDETQPTKFAAGNVWTIIDTNTESGNKALAWFEITPGFDGSGNLTATLAHQGYVAIAGNSVDYGAFAVKADGSALIAMDVAGPTIFGSSGYGLLDVESGLDAVHIAGTGLVPDDGFTCYAAFVGDRTRGCRWGDYSDANVGTDGKFWFSGIYFTNAQRRSLSNWKTFLGST